MGKQQAVGPTFGPPAPKPEDNPYPSKTTKAAWWELWRAGRELKLAVLNSLPGRVREALTSKGQNVD
jgi:hypothetical protein